MRMRRGTDFWPGELGGMVHSFKRGDVVVSTLVPQGTGYFTGVVREVRPELNKVLVAWGGGGVKQHDPDEIMLHPTGAEFIRGRMDEVVPRYAARRVAQGGFPVVEFVDRFLQLYSQFFLFHWQTRAYGQHIAFDEANEDLEDLMDEFVEAYQGKYGRVSTAGGLPVADYDDASAEEFVQDYRDFLSASKDMLGDDDAVLANVIDEMVARVDKLLYLLTLE